MGLNWLWKAVERGLSVEKEKNSQKNGKERQRKAKEGKEIQRDAKKSKERKRIEANYQK